ncbi:cytochrome d ubiquinol oxidase subunit II [Prosthecomicrobium sp. N25]
MELLPVVWIALIGTAVALYVILDGFDLGVGILFATARGERERDTIMNSVAPFWDGNETWLVLGGGGLFVAFPLAYSIILPALYEPVIVMLLALIFRGVAFEYRWVAKPNHGIWDVAFAGGSILAAFAQGLVLGGLVQGIRVADGQFAGGSLDWLTPFSVLCGLGLVAGYAMIGAGWLMMRVEGEVADHARRLAPWLLVGLAAFVAAVSLWTPFASPRVSERWFAAETLRWLWPLPTLAAGLVLLVWASIRSGGTVLPFLGTIGIFLLCFAGLAVSSWPYVVPDTVTIWQAAAAPESQIFSLVGTLLLLPVVLGYSVFVYWTFRGRLRSGEGYH